MKLQTAEQAAQLLKTWKEPHRRGVVSRARLGMKGYLIVAIILRACLSWLLVWTMSHFACHFRLTYPSQPQAV